MPIGKIDLSDGSHDYEQVYFQDLKLLYIFADAANINANKYAKQFGGILVDEKVLLVKNIQKNQKSTQSVIFNSTAKEVIEKVCAIGIQSSEFSRFRVDANFNKNEWFRLYKHWMVKSISREIADDVFVFLEDDNPAGVATINKVGDRMNIGIIAVASEVRGKGIGKDLINKCENYCLENSLNLLQVATQKRNVKALEFYKRNSFTVESLTNVYHVWNK